MTLTDIRNALASLDTSPRQSLGQNFLHDQNLCQWIANQIEIAPGDHVVEIGPGLGSLTERLYQSDGHLTLIEKDQRMVSWLRKKYVEPNVELFHMDALDFDLRKLYGKGPVKLVGNLPYYVSTPLIAKFASALSPASTQVFTLQHEVAARLSGVPGGKEFGAMSICTSRRWNVTYLKKIPPTVFYPEPQISSAVVLFKRKTGAEVPVCNEVVFERLVRQGFSKRRKQLHNLLPEYRDIWPQICGHLGVLPSVRAEELCLTQWEKMARFLSPIDAQRGEERFDVVDEQDKVIGSEERQIVHVNNLRHRASHMVIFNKAGELFLQKRSIWKDRHPGLWDSSAAGHVDAGETYEEAAHRELKEEIGVDSPLRNIGRLPCTIDTGWEFIEVYRGEHEGPFRLAPLEVETGMFFPLAQVKTWLARSPEEFSPVFRRVFGFIEADGQ